MKIYNERAISDYAHSTGPSGMAMEARRVEGYGREMDREAVKYERQGKNIYSSALNTQWQNSVNDLMTNPEIANNPKRMEAEITKLNNKMSSEIVDNDVKVDFMANSLLNSRSYINMARNNFIKLQNERENAAAFDRIYGGMGLAGVSALNVLSGGGTSDDIVTYMNSRENVMASINAKRPDGLYIFTNEQRLKMANDYDVNVIKSFKAAYDNAEDDQKEAFYKKVMGDDVFVVQSDKGPLNINAKDVLTPTMMRDVKNYVRNERYKRLNEKKKEREYNFSLALAEYNKNPTKTGLEGIRKAFPEIKKEKLEDLEKSYEESGNYIVEDKGTALLNAQNKILEMASFTDDLKADENGVKKTKSDKRFDALVEFNKYLNTQHIKNGGTLDDDDIEKLRDASSLSLTNMISDDLAPKLEMMNNKFTRGVAKVGSYLPFSSVSRIFANDMDVKGAEYSNAEQRKIKKEISRISQRTWKMVHNILTDQNLSDEEKEKQANAAYQYGSRMVINTVNPEVAGKNIDDTFSRNGLTYRIVGFDNFDVQTVQLVKGAK